jgi:hypothetical protein
MIGRKVDGILIIQTDSKAVIPAIRAANEAGIPMVHFNRPPAESDAYSVAIQADNRKIMADTVQFLVDEAKKMGGKYKACLLIGDLGDINAIQRRDGFFDVVDKNPTSSRSWPASRPSGTPTRPSPASPTRCRPTPTSTSSSPRRTSCIRRSSRCCRPRTSGTSAAKGHVLFAGFDGDEGAYASA